MENSDSSAPDKQTATEGYLKRHSNFFPYMVRTLTIFESQQNKWPRICIAAVAIRKDQIILGRYAREG